ncbi:BTAD domain-containing putative transcriptional regulator [Actinokineospora sp. NPDC004072]
MLGPVGAHAGGRRVAPVGARQERVLAALLLDAGRVVPVSRLVDVVWDGEPPATASRQIRNVTTGLRRTLVAAGLPPDALTAVGPGFALHPPEFDLRAFDHHVERGAYAEALACWRGPALAGIGSPALAGAAAALDERRLSVLHLRLAEQVAAGHDVVAELTDLVARHPLVEGFTALLMRALHHQGRQADALAAYHATRRRLVDELGVEPGADLRAAHQHVLGAEPTSLAAEPTRPCYLPAEIPDFTGRAAELAAVVAALPTPVVIDGMAGVGKTALAVRAAHRAAGRFPDGQLYVDLHGYTPGRERVAPGDALGTLLWQAGVPAAAQPPGVDERAALWRARTAGRRLVVLIDNAADAGQVLPLLPGAPAAAVITSRRRLVEVDGAVPVPLDPLPAGEAAELFAAVAGRPDAGVAELCGNLPLAVRIAAARLRQRPQWTADGLAARLGRERDRLAELRVGGRDVAATFQLSYRELDAARQRMFRLLGSHPGGVITAPAAAALAELPVAAAERLMEDLLDAHLVEPEHGGYRLHDLLAEFARRLSDDDGFARLLAYYRTGGGRDWYAAERSSLRAVVQRAVEREWDESAWLIADHAAPHLRDHQDFRAVAEAAARAAARLGDPAALHRALGHLADACWDDGDLAGALACTRRRLRMPVPAPAAAATALSRMGALHAMSGQYAASMDCYHRALALVDDPDVVALLLGNLSHAQEMLGDLPAALSSIQRSLDLATTADNPARVVLSAAQEALILAKLGTGPAADRAEEALHAAEQLDYPFGAAWAHTDYAEVLLINGDPTAARAHADRACAILADINHPLLLVMADNTLATACLRTDDPRTALAHHRRAHTTARRVGYRRQAERAAEGIARAQAAMHGPRPL